MYSSEKFGKTLSIRVWRCEMKEQLPIEEFVSLFMEELRYREYAATTLDEAAVLSRQLLKFAEKSGAISYSTGLGRQFLVSKYPEHVDMQYVRMPRGLRNKRCVVMLMNQFLIDDAITRIPRGNEGLREDDKMLLESFSQRCQHHGNAAATIEKHIYHLKRFMRHLNSSHRTVTDVSEADLIEFLGSMTGQSDVTLANVNGSLKQFFSFLFENGITPTDLSLQLPKARITRLARIPSVWPQGDVEKLLAAVDRGNPVGKRDYAILLTVAKMGLRTGDVFSLKNENINWRECRIEFTQGKTGQPVSLPLQDDVGWAIIDYLKNGRPACDSPLVFVNHFSPTLGEPLKPQYGITLMEKCIRQAKLPMKGRQKHGLHSLRHTLATRLLEAKTPLPVITGILGQVSPEAVEKYLKVDVESLRCCALDPEEVFSNA